MPTDYWTAFYEIFGFIGVALYLGSYAALQFGLISGNRYPYAVMNLLAAISVLISLVGSFNLWSAIIQISWIVISVIGLTRLYLLWRNTRFNAEEQALLNHKLPELSAQSARRFLDIGTWSDAPAGQVLATEGEVIGRLYYIARGSASAEVGGRNVGKIGGGEFLGEVTCFNGNPASASVITAEPVRLFEADAARLRSLARTEPELGLCLQQCLMRETSAKLVAANTRLSAGATAAI